MYYVLSSLWRFRETFLMKRKFKGTSGLILTAAFSLACLVLSGCNQDDAKQQNITSGIYTKADLLLSCNGTDVANDTRAAKRFAELLEEKSNGAMTVRVFDNDQLASNNQKKGLELAALGIVDFDLHSTSIMGNLDQRIMISTLPWLFKDYQAAEDAFFGDGGKYLNEVLAPKGLTYLGAVHNGFKAITNSKHPILEPKDLNGLKIRIPGGELFYAFYEAFGASPQAMSWGEVFTALQQGTIDGHDNSLSTIKSANIQEVQKYISITNYTYEAFTFTANTEHFNKLNAASQELVRECAEQACKEINKLAVAEESNIKQEFIEKNGCEVDELSESQIAEFKEVVKPLIEKYKAVYGEKACKAWGVQ